MTEHDSTTAPKLAKALLGFFHPDGSNWCHGTWARDANHQDVLVEHPSAVRFCAFGAVMRLLDVIDPEDIPLAVYTAAGDLAESVFVDRRRDLAYLNDCLTYPEFRSELQCVADGTYPQLG